MTSIVGEKDNQAILDVAGTPYRYVPILHEADAGRVARLPVSMKILYENISRYRAASPDGLKMLDALTEWTERPKAGGDISLFPNRVVLPDSSGVPVLAELAAMRDSLAARGLDPQALNPAIPVDLVIDHSAITQFAGTADALDRNLALEYASNRERYAFLRWAGASFSNVRLMPPGSGIIHQVNLEYLARPIWSRVEGTEKWAFPDTLVGSDSHTPMINALGVIGWGVGGIEAVSAALGEPITLAIPEVIGCRLSGALPVGTSASDAVLAVVTTLRKAGVVGKFVEFLGEGAASLSLPDRATISNMAPEYGATMGFFPIDEKTIAYLALTGRSAQDVALTEAYARAQGLWGMNDPARVYSHIVDIDLTQISPSAAGPRRPNELRKLEQVPASVVEAYPQIADDHPGNLHDPTRSLRHGDVVITAITSCTTTSNPALLIAAGLLAQKARAAGLNAKPWIKRSLSPGSRVVTEYLRQSGLLDDLEALGFYVAGYGCMSCGGATGPLAPDIARQIEDGDLVVAAVQSSNRNFEGRIHPQVRPSYLTSPALTVAYAIAGTTMIDLIHEPLGINDQGAFVMLKDIWPTEEEVKAVQQQWLRPTMFIEKYADMFSGDDRWKALGNIDATARFHWDADSSFLRPPPYVDRLEPPVADILDARPLLLFGDSVTTDHISPAGTIPTDSVAAAYLRGKGVQDKDLGNYVSRRVNADVMVRGTFANPRIVNELMKGKAGPFTVHQPSGDSDSIYAVAMRYKAEHVPAIVIAGHDYGAGSSRDWAAKGTLLLGVKAVIAQSFERIHRTNLVGMGVLPLQFADGVSRHSLAIDGTETFSILGLGKGVTVGAKLRGVMRRMSGDLVEFDLLCRVETERETEWLRGGGILPHILAGMADS